MTKPSEIQQAYNELINCINDMAKDAGGLRVTDMAAIKGMTDAVINLKKELTAAQQEATAYRISLENLEAESEKLKKELEEVKYCAEWNQHDLSLASEYKKSLDDIKASLPKIKADAVRAFDIPELDSVGDERVVLDALNEYINKLEAGE